MTRFGFVSMALIVLVGCADQPANDRGALVQDIAEHSPDEARIVFENDWVKLVEFNLKRGESLPRHTGVERVVYALDDYEVEWMEEGSAPVTKRWQRGTAHRQAGTDHEIRNVGQTVARFVAVWRKDDAVLPNAANGAEEGAAAAVPALARVVLEDDRIRVSEVTLAPGDRLPSHAAGNRVIYALSDFTISWDDGTRTAEEKTWRAGQAHWHVGGEHAVGNVGETTAHYVVFSFKE